MTVPSGMEAVAEAVPRLEALRLRDLLGDAGVVCVLDPDGGLDLGRATDVLVAAERAEFARRVIADAEAGADWVADDSPEGLIARIEEHLDALRGLVKELSDRIERGDGGS